MPPSRRSASGRRSVRDQAGFTIIESLIALGLVFGVLVGLLGALNTGVRGITTGRQRGVAVAIANGVMETARSRSYADVGHDLDSDPTLAGDSALQGTVPVLFYKDLAPGPQEPLVGSVVDAGADAGSPSNPLFPFSPHRWPTLREATTYTTSVYVTRVVPASGDPYRRLTVIVTWDRSLDAASALPPSVRLSSFLFNAIQPPDPLFVGRAEADAGTVTVTGTLEGIGLTDARMWLPYAHGEIDSRFVRRATGFAGTARSLTSVQSGSVSGCSVSNGGFTAECPGVKAETGSDNDAATAPADHNSLGPTSGPPVEVVAGGGVLRSRLGTGTAQSLSTARSCWACFGSGIDDNDLLPYQWAKATGPGSMSMPFSAGSVTGSLLTSTGSCSDCSTVTLNRDDDSGPPLLLTESVVEHAAIDLVTLTGFLPDYAGMVQVPATRVTASADSGPGALPPSADGQAFTVQMYQTNQLPPYRTVTVEPGTPSEATSHAEMVSASGRVVMDATVRSGPKVALSTSSGGALIESQASLSNWLTISVHLVATDPMGAPLANLVISVDYGRVTTRATYEPAPA